MHLWPSLKLRDSFKREYLKKLEWNLLRMKIDQQNQAGNSDSNQQKLLDGDKNDQESGPADNSKGRGGGAVVGFCREVFLIFSCCYCCFCCGACVDDEENN